MTAGAGRQGSDNWPAFTLPLAADFDGHVTVAYSGGLDSTVLLHATLRWAQAHQIAIDAIHIHHGLQPQADAWAEHCVRTAEALDVPCRVVRVAVARRARHSLEDAARQARYAAFTAHVAPGMLLTAHHLQDQAETVLLRLERGSGPLGLAAMAAERPLRADLRLVRPLLHLRRAQLEAYAVHHQLRWIDDPSNDNHQFSRNRIRHHLLPYWREATPHIDQALADVAQHCRDAAVVMADMADMDLARLQRLDGSLCATGLRQLSAPRLRNALRAWLMVDDHAPPAAAGLATLMTQVACTRDDAQPEVVLSGWRVRRYQQGWYRCLPAPPLDVSTVVWCDVAQPLLLPADLGVLALRSGGDLRSPSADEVISVRFGLVGSTRCHPAQRPHGRELVKLWQELGVAPWLRGRVPMLFYGERLVAAIGYWIERDHAVEPGSGIAPVLQAPANASRR